MVQKVRFISFCSSLEKFNKRLEGPKYSRTTKSRLLNKVQLKIYGKKLKMTTA